MKFMQLSLFKSVRLSALSPITIAISALYSPLLLATEDMDVIEVHGEQLNKSAYLGSAEQLLKEQGVDFSAAGGMSSLPILNGLMGDRVKVLVDGADITAACANHMNPPLSYISANQIHSLNVVAGISPVSAAGDNIAGVISVNSIAAQFNSAPSLQWQSGYLSGQYRSINQGKSLGLGASVASENISISYQGSYDDANSYQDGNSDKVLDTLYRAQNHTLSAAFRDDKQQLALKLSHQTIPFQGFPNQYMDMTDNNSLGLTAQYVRQLDDGEFEGQANWHHVKHEMGFFSDEKIGMMPMNTDGKDISYQLEWRLPLASQQLLRLGQEYYHYQLDDYWPAVAGSMMMGPNAFVNINDGTRQRLAVFAELEQQINSHWQVSSGVRVEYVTTNTGEVQGYTDGMSMGGMMDVNAAAAQVFNDLDRKKSDTLVDASVLARYQMNPDEQFELGLARKNRAPNLYERYSWGRSTMATTMIGWYGDGNGYVGNPQLEAETAYTLSGSYIKSAQDEGWQFKLNLWYSKVSDYIDADVMSTFNRTTNEAGSRNILQFSNVDASLYGSRLEASMGLTDSDSLGQIRIKAQLNTTHGERDDNDQPLYQIKPLQTELALQQRLGNWQNSLVWQWVAEKDRVDKQRLENMTDSYHLLNFNSELSLESWKLSLSVSNLLDEYYQMPLGGISIAQYKQDTSQGFQQLAGEGRSFNFGLSYQF
jgi:iron complex outermembrane receptor protein